MIIFRLDASFGNKINLPADDNVSFVFNSSQNIENMVLDVEMLKLIFECHDRHMPAGLLNMLLMGQLA
jgi:hypothetical protein